MAGGGYYFDTCYTYLNGNSELGIKKCVVDRYPRERFQIAEKLPGYKCRSYEDAQRFFDEELERCGVEYFDVFMLHWLNGKNYEIAERYENGNREELFERQRHSSIQSQKPQFCFELWLY